MGVQETLGEGMEMNCLDLHFPETAVPNRVVRKAPGDKDFETEPGEDPGTGSQGPFPQGGC